MTVPTPDPDPAESAAPPEGVPPAPKPTFEERMNGFGREAEEAGHRLASDPGVQRAADTAGRVWGLIVLAVGIWFLADVTLDLDMPVVPWGDVWPLGLILLGGLIVFRAMGRRRA